MQCLAATIAWLFHTRWGKGRSVVVDAQCGEQVYASVCRGAGALQAQGGSTCCVLFRPVQLQHPGACLPGSCSKQHLLIFLHSARHQLSSLACCCTPAVPRCRQQGRAALHALLSLNHCLMERGQDHLSVLPAVHQQVYPLVCYVWDATSLPVKVRRSGLGACMAAAGGQVVPSLVADSTKVASPQYRHQRLHAGRLLVVLAKCRLGVTRRSSNSAVACDCRRLR